MPKDDAMVFEGTVREVCRDAKFMVELSGKENDCLKGCKVLATINGKMRMHFIRILEGDWVKLEIPPEEMQRLMDSKNPDAKKTDLPRGRITYRGK